jgi:folate-dependent phosphoribosylglycinamide formyltransferase PurN
MHQESSPKIVLLCHHDDPIDLRGLAAWLASSLQLVGIVVIRDRRARKWRAVRAERRRSGWPGVVDVLAFRAYDALVNRRANRRWIEAAVADLERRYPAGLDAVPRIEVPTPNGPETREFLRRVGPDIAIARCKHLLKPEVFSIPRAGTVVFHPGICPEYRNAHGCFWALANRDLSRVGMTVLRIDAGVDTGPALLQAGYAFDEARESHTIIQYRAVLENLEAIRDTLIALARHDSSPLDLAGRSSNVWGQPRLTAYLAWKRAARRDRHHASRLTAVS